MPQPLGAARPQWLFADDGASRKEQTSHARPFAFVDYCVPNGRISPRKDPRRSHVTTLRTRPCAEYANVRAKAASVCLRRFHSPRQAVAQIAFAAKTRRVPTRCCGGCATTTSIARPRAYRCRHLGRNSPVHRAWVDEIADGCLLCDRNGAAVHPGTGETLPTLDMV